MAKKAHIVAAADSGLVRTLITTPTNAHGITEAYKLVHGDETAVSADSGYRGVHRRPQVKQAHPDINSHMVMIPGHRRKLDKGKQIDQLERTKARIRSKVEHPFHVIKRQFGHVKVRCRELAKNRAQLHTLFALATQPLREQEK